MRRVGSRRLLVVRSRGLLSFGQPAGLGCVLILMRQKPNGSPSRLRLSCQVSEVVAICDHLAFFILRELKQKKSGDQRSQNICEKSLHKHILKLA